MGPGATSHPVHRTWTVEVRPHTGGPLLTCTQCGTLPDATGSAITRTAVLAHLAGHARSQPLAPHWRTCQCGQSGCRWHPELTPVWWSP